MRLLYTVLLIGCGFLFMMYSVGCKKLIEVKPPLDQIVSSTVFFTEASATAAVTAIYSSMMNQTFGYASAGMTLYTGLSSDEFVNHSVTASQAEFYLNSLSIQNSTIADLWSTPYSNIYAANSAIEGLQKASAIPALSRDQLLGEAKFIRAFCHFYLANLFGDIPVITSTDYRINGQAFRAPQKQVFQQVISDLKDAQGLLSNDYQFSSNERVRPTKWAAMALLARVYLYDGDYADAEAEASAVIGNAGLFTLVPDLNSVFLKNSMEAIWQLMPVLPNQNTNEGRFFILIADPAESVPGVTISNSLLTAFEPGDNRKTDWIGSFSDNGNDFYFPHKYKVKTTPVTVYTEYYTVLRLAEQYLIRAEARTQQGKFMDAAVDLNIIRARAGIGGTIANDKPSLLLAIEQERRVELFAEWGHRWFDLKRTNRADPILSVIKFTNWQTTDALYPIPRVQIDNDPNTTQNPGY